MSLSTVDHLPPSAALSAPSASGAPAQRVVGRPLGELLLLMQSDRAALREAAWAECYRRYHEVVWTRVFYVMRSVSWLPEPREVAEDVASDVFVGLPDAARHYREQGRAEWWLKQVAVRTALRKKAALTGRWSSGRRPADDPRNRGRRAVSLDEAANEVVQQLDAIEPEELIELERRLDRLRNSPDPTRRRWAEFIALYVEGCSFHEIGECLNLSDGTVRNWLCQIRKYLAQPVVSE